MLLLLLLLLIFLFIMVADKCPMSLMAVKIAFMGSKSSTGKRLKASVSDKIVIWMVASDTTWSIFSANLVKAIVETKKKNNEVSEKICVKLQ